MLDLLKACQCASFDKKIAGKQTADAIEDEHQTSFINLLTDLYLTQSIIDMKDIW